MQAAAATLMLLLGLIGPAWGQGPPDEGAGAAIRDVISRQLQAFSRDDADGAFAFASPGIQDQFGSPGNFLEMVRRAYPPVHRSRSAEFTGLTVVDDVPIQRVELIGPDGTAHLALYSMEWDSAGLWRISGCVLVPSARAGA